MPAIAEANDWLGRSIGSPLCPERYDAIAMKAMQNVATLEGWSAMYQQKPLAGHAGLVYRNFSIENNVDNTLTIRPFEPIHFAFDFNVNPGVHCIVGQYDQKGDLLTDVYEIFSPRMTTQEAADYMVKFCKKFRATEAHIFGDRSGNSGNHQTAETDYDIIKRALVNANIEFIIKVPKTNPHIKDRIQCANDAMLDSRGIAHYRMNGMNCPRLLKDYKCVKSDEKGLIEKESNLDLSHACLVSGTMITTDSGLVPIENISVGTMVMNRNGSFNRVTNSWMNNPCADTKIVRFSNGSILTGTINHPIWVIGKGFVDIGNLKVGMEINSCELKHAPVHVVDISEGKQEPVYDLTVETSHEFYANGILVSNSDASSYRTHWLRPIRNELSFDVQSLSAVGVAIANQAGNLLQ